MASPVQSVNQLRLERVARRRARHEKSYDPIGSLLPQAERLERIQGLTLEAKRATHPVGKQGRTDYNFLRRTRKSGLTPVPLPATNQPTRSDEEKSRDIQTKWLQRRKFAGFSTQELEDMNCLIYKDNAYNLMGNLSNPIHPIFQRSQWCSESQLPKQKGSIPIYGDSNKFWSADNDDVWRILEPCCQLVSIVLQSASAYPWLDALLNDNVREIHNADPEYGYLEELFPRTILARSQANETQKTDSKLIGMASEIQFQFYSGYTDSSVDLPIENQPEDGETNTDSITYRQIIFISIEILQPLLRTDLSQAERLQGTWIAASVLLHEFAHAAWQLVRLERPDTARFSDFEPIYKDEELSELGFSFEEKLWGGFAKDYPQGGALSRGGPGLPKFAILKGNWFRECNVNYRSRSYPVISRRPDTPDPRDNVFKQFDHWPISTSWVKNLFQSSLWNNVNAKGPELVYMGPLTIGTRIISGEPQIPDYYRLMHESVFDGNLLSTSNISTGDTAETARLTQEENARKAHRDAISAAMAEDVFQNTLRSDDDFDSEGSETEDEIEEEVYDCPRWDEITQYLFASRAPLELGLDDMTIISEPTFYRYIRDHGFINLTPREFRNFLGTANARGQLFLYSAFPGVGCLMRIDAGWPPVPPLRIPRPTVPVSDDIVDAFADLLAHKPVRDFVFEWYREPGDVDINKFWDAMDDQYDMSSVPKDRLRDVLLAYMGRNQTNRDATIGPEGIIRFQWTNQELSDYSIQYPNPFIDKLIRKWKRRARRCLAAWEGRIASPSPPSTPSNISSSASSLGDSDNGPNLPVAPPVASQQQVVPGGGGDSGNGSDIDMGGTGTEIPDPGNNSDEEMGGVSLFSPA